MVLIFTVHKHLHWSWDSVSGICSLSIPKGVFCLLPSLGLIPNVQNLQMSILLTEICSVVFTWVSGYLTIAHRSWEWTIQHIQDSVDHWWRWASCFPELLLYHYRSFWRTPDRSLGQPSFPWTHSLRIISSDEASVYRIAKAGGLQRFLQESIKSLTNMNSGFF